MIDSNYLHVLCKIYDGLKDSNINWVITGSFGFALQGLKTKIHDIDIQTDTSGAYEIECRFSDFIVRKVTFSSTKRIRSHFGVLKIDGIKVEIMGDIQKRLENGTWENHIDLTKYKKFIEIEGMKIPVLSLEYEYRAYLKLGRIQKAKMLKTWLDSELN